MVVGATLALLDARPAGQSQAESLVTRGITALHLFEYEQANELFRQARQLNPELALAYWGEALTYHQTLWGHEDVEAGRQALARLPPTSRGGEAASRTPRDQGLLDAAAVLFGEGDRSTRRQQDAEARGRHNAQDPEDPDVASLYALALLGTMSRSLVGTADAHEGHSQAVAGSD